MELLYFWTMHFTDGRGIAARFETTSRRQAKIVRREHGNRGFKSGKLRSRPLDA